MYEQIWPARPESVSARAPAAASSDHWCWCDACVDDWDWVRDRSTG